MANTPNMLLPLDPYIGQSNATPGPQWASDIETTKNLVDLHTHVSTKGSFIISLQPQITGVATFAVPNPAAAMVVYEVLSTTAFQPVVTLPLSANGTGVMLIFKDIGGGTAHPWSFSANGAETIMSTVGNAPTLTVNTSYAAFRFVVVEPGKWGLV